MPVIVPSKIVVVGTSSISLKDRFSKLPKPKLVSSKVLIILYFVWFILFDLGNCATQSKLHARTEEGYGELFFARNRSQVG